MQCMDAIYKSLASKCLWFIFAWFNSSVTLIKKMSWYLPSATMLLSFLECEVRRVGIRKFWTDIHLFPNTNLSLLNPPAHVAEARICSQVHGCMMETVTQVDAGSNVCHLLSRWGMGPFTYSNQFRLSRCSCEVLHLPVGFDLLQCFAMNQGGGVPTLGSAVASCSSICAASQRPTSQPGWEGRRRQEEILGDWLSRGSCFFPGGTGLDKLMIPLDYQTDVWTLLLLVPKWQNILAVYMAFMLGVGEKKPTTTKATKK